MKHLLLFEQVEKFPDNFGNSLLRGSKVDKNQYIDNPKERSVNIGSPQFSDYFYFNENYSKLGLQNPNSGCHFYLNPNESLIDDLKYRGFAFRLLPEIDSKFSFSKFTQRFGLGITWSDIPKCLEDLYIIDFDDYGEDDFEIFINDGAEEHFKNPKKDIKDLLKIKEIWLKDKKRFYDLITDYQKMLISKKMVGNFSYEQLLEAKEKGEILQIWTESLVLHKRL